MSTLPVSTQHRVNPSNSKNLEQDPGRSGAGAGAGAGGRPFDIRAFYDLFHNSTIPANLSGLSGLDGQSVGERSPPNLETDRLYYENARTLIRNGDLRADGFVLDITGHTTSSMLAMMEAGVVDVSIIVPDPVEPVVARRVVQQLLAVQGALAGRGSTGSGGIFVGIEAHRNVDGGGVPPSVTSLIRMPTAQDLLERGINTFTVVTERQFGRESFGNHLTGDSELNAYLKYLQDNGIEVSIVGVRPE